MSITTVLVDIQEMTPAWLNNCLGRTLDLGSNYVMSVEVVNTRETRVSSTYSIQIDYAKPDQTLPKRLFLKLSMPGQFFAREEVTFYDVLVPAMTEAFSQHNSPFVRCFDAAYATEPERSHLLLADMSLTHFTNQAHMPPSEELCRAVVDAYAHFHAFWWEHRWLGKQVGYYLTDDAIDDVIQKAQLKLIAMREVVGDALTTHQQDVLYEISRGWPTRRRERVVAGKGVTIVHRDPHPLNMLYPLNPSADSVKLIDWQSWRVDTGTDDLAYLMACHWPLEEYPGLEQSMVAHYGQRLEAAGIQGYGWDDLQYDYQASIIRCLFFLLIAWSSRQWAEGVWQRRIMRGLNAFDRWACGELLE